MCGIVGQFNTRATDPIDLSLLAEMNDSLRHRGPDGDGLFSDPGIGLGHRRLAIIDIAEGQQPLFNEDASVVVVYNGEIYNFRELADILAAAGHRFRTRCDTEVIVHAWEEWGEDCVEKFRGMFAFALWDKNKQCLMLARDRFGIKPLFYALKDNGVLIFGSELKALLCDSDLPRRVDAQAVEDYLAFGYVPDPKTIFGGVRKLAPGHTLVWRRGQEQAAPRQYWDIRFAPDAPADDPAAVGEALIEQLRDAVKCRLISEVPLGAFLSGGVDSGAVVAMMAGLSDDPVRTCSISFGEPEYDESRFADMVARRYRTDHRTGRVEPDDFDLIEILAGLYDEPFADSSAMPTYRVCALARQHVTVALSGDGGDEMFAGYRRHFWHAQEDRIRRKFPHWFRKPVFGALGALYPKIDWAPRFLRAKSTLQSLGRDSIDGYFHSVSVVYDGLRQSLYSDDFKTGLQGYSAHQILREHMEKAETDDPVSQVQYADMKTYLPGDILTKVDRASMAHSLEVRVPILDHRFAEWSAGLPSSVKLRGREGKWIFKKSLESYLPEEVLYRPKMGFAVPLAKWFRGALQGKVREIVESDVIADCGIFDQSRLNRLVTEHQSGARDHSAALWSLVMFEAFMRRTGATI